MKLKLSLILMGFVGLSGCATVDIKTSIDQTNQALKQFTQGELQLYLKEDDQQQRQQKITQLLSEPLAKKDAISLLLINSPAMQSLLANNWQLQTQAAQSGRIPNPVFALERVRSDDELEIGRILSFGLLDVLSLPAKQQSAQWKIKQSQTQLASDVVKQISEVQNAWIDAVVAHEMKTYSHKVVKAAQASAELAQRMQKVGTRTPP